MSDQFDAQFERDVLTAAAKDPAYRRRARRVLSDHNFTDNRHSWLWRVISELGPHDKLTAGLVMVNARKAFSKEDEQYEAMQLGRDVLKKKAMAPVASLRELEDFRLYHELNNGIERALKLMDRGKVREARAELRKITRGDVSLEYDYTDWWEDHEHRQEMRKYYAEHPEERIQVATTFLPSLDRAIGGGIDNAELGLIVGTTGRGKSAIATNLAYTGVMQGYKTLYITTEMEHLLVATRLDARAYGMTYDQFKFYDLNEDELARIERKRRRMARQFGGMRIVHMPVRRCTNEAVEQALEDYQPQLLIMDSFDHMEPSSRAQNRRDRETAAYWDAKSIASEYQIPVWSTTHAPKDVVNKVATAENVGESYDKARIADIVVTLNQNKALFLKGQMKVYLAKYRQGRSRVMVTVQADTSRMYFKEVEAEEEKDGDGEEAAA